MEDGERRALSTHPDGLQSAQKWAESGAAHYGPDPPNPNPTPLTPRPPSFLHLYFSLNISQFSSSHFHSYTVNKPWYSVLKFIKIILLIWTCTCKPFLIEDKPCFHSCFTPSFFPPQSVKQSRYKWNSQQYMQLLHSHFSFFTDTDPPSLIKTKTKLQSVMEEISLADAGLTMLHLFHKC